MPTFLSPSVIHGIGVYTPLPIPAGTVLWEFTDEVDWVLTPSELEAFPERLRQQVASYSYLDDRGLYVLCGDNARYMNHSTTPNCDDVGDYTVALLDIDGGAELTCDYRSFDRGPWEAFVSSGDGAPKPPLRG